MPDQPSLFSRSAPLPAEVRTFVARSQETLRRVTEIAERGGDWEQVAKNLRSAGDDLVDASVILTREHNIRERLKQAEEKDR